MEAQLSAAILNLITLARNVAIAVAGFMFLVAGYQALTSGGNPRGMESAKQTAKDASIGLLLIFACTVIANAIGNAVRFGS